MTLISLGFHRVYRRLLEGTKKLNMSPENTKAVKNGVKLAIRSPTEILSVLKQAEIQTFIKQYSSLSTQLENVPPFMNSLLSEVVRQSESSMLRLYKAFGFK